MLSIAIEHNMESKGQDFWFRVYLPWPIQMK